MTEFQKENAKKMAVYNDNIVKIADYLFVKFYKPEMDDYYDPESEEIEKNRCLDKATRLYQFFNSVEDIKRMVNFINTINPGMARDLIEGL